MLHPHAHVHVLVFITVKVLRKHDFQFLPVKSQSLVRAKAQRVWWLHWQPPRARVRQDCMRYDLPDIKIRAFKRSTFAQRSRKPRIKSWVARTLRNPSYLSSTEEKRKGKGLKNRFYHRQCLPFTGIAHQNNQTLYGQNIQTVVRFTTTSEAKSDQNRRNRQNTGYFPGIPGVF